jgi:exonuclease VII small subunit
MFELKDKICIGVVIVLSIFLFLSLLVVKYYKTSYDEQLEKIGELKVSVKGLEQGIDTCNQSVDNLKKASDIRERNAHDEIQKAKDKARTVEKKAQEILLYKPVSNDSCGKAEEIIDKYIKDMDVAGGR